MNIQKPPHLVASMIAGSGFGFAGGLMTKGEELENSGASEIQQIAGSISGGLKTGITGAAIGAGVSGTVGVLNTLLRKR